MEKIKNAVLSIKNMEIDQIVDIIIALVIVIVFLIISSSLAYLILKIFFKKETKEDIRKTKLYNYIRIFFNLLGVYVGTKIIELSTKQDQFIDKCFKVIVIWTIANIIYGIIEQRERIFQRIKSKNSEKKDLNKKDQFTATILGKIIQLVSYIIATYLTLKEFGYDLGGLATGLGIGGAIVALAAQGIVKQLLAGLAIFSDKPFEIGDWIEVGDAKGTVESITWRSTKIRMMEDPIIIIDNAVLVESKIINYGKIVKRAFKGNLKLPLETEEATVEKVLNRIRFILKYNKEIIKESISVQLLHIEPNYLDIAIYLETTVTDYKEYLGFCNKINLTILNILESQGVKLAYPGQNIYIKENKENIIFEKNIENNKSEKKKTKPTKIKK